MLAPRRQEGLAAPQQEGLAEQTLSPQGQEAACHIMSPTAGSVPNRHECLQAYEFAIEIQIPIPRKNKIVLLLFQLLALS